MSALLIALLAATVAAWLFIVVRTIRQILHEVEGSTAQGLWIFVVLSAPFLGPFVWALVRGYGRKDSAVTRL